MLPGFLQTTVEGIVATIDEAISAVAPEHGRQIMPFIATLWLFLIIANLVGLIPGLHSPTRDLSVTSALAVLVFFSVHWYGIKTLGAEKLPASLFDAQPRFCCPFISSASLPALWRLAIRLFGNMMSLEMAAMLILLVAGFLAPIPILMLHIIEAFGAGLYFRYAGADLSAGAMQSQHLNSQE